MKTLLAALGLAALAAGCGVDERKDIVKATCTIGGVEAKAVYHQIDHGSDYMTLDFYKGGAIIGRINPNYSSWMQCDDGRIWNFEGQRVMGTENAESSQ